MRFTQFQVTFQHQMLIFSSYLTLRGVKCSWKYSAFKLAMVHVPSRTFKVNQECDINLFLMMFLRMSPYCKLVPVQYWEYGINLFLMICLCLSHYCMLVPVQYREYDINLFLMIFPRMSLHSKLVPVQYREYLINLFLMILLCMSLNCKLVPVQYQEHKNGLLKLERWSLRSHVSRKNKYDLNQCI